MDFGIFSMFNSREGATQAETFKEWFDLVQVVEETGLDTFWLGESHVLPLSRREPGPQAVPEAPSSRARCRREHRHFLPDGKLGISHLYQAPDGSPSPSGIFEELP